MPKLQTKAVQSQPLLENFTPPVCLPIYQTVNYEMPQSDSQEFRYARYSNSPNHHSLALRLADLENAESAIVTGSGMAAISTTLFSLFSSGDHLLVQDQIYGGTMALLLTECRTLGISFTLIDPNNPDDWKAKLLPSTRGIYVETIANPKTEIPDFRAVVDFAKENQLVSIVDNTFASPVIFRPAEVGFDLSLHSATKYLNGHSDLAAGAVIGKEKWVQKVTTTLSHMGGVLDPHTCFLLERGMKTLFLRVREQSKSSLVIAEFLSDHEKVKKVFYPGLESHPNHLRAKEYFEGFCGVISFELEGGISEAEKFISQLKIPIHAASLGGVESLVVRPAASSHKSFSREDRERMGISDTLVRLSVGIEAVEDLMEDLENSLASI